MKTGRLESKNRAVRFVSDLAGISGPKKFYRVFVRHWEFFESLRKDDETWDSIANLLTQVGARHRRGQVISAAQLREYNSRRNREVAKSGLDATQDKIREQSGGANEQDKPRSVSSSNTATRQNDARVENREAVKRSIATSRISQRLEMMTKTRQGKKYDLEE